MERNLSEEDILELREAVRPYLKPKRYAHTLAVEKEAARLGALFLPEKVNPLRAAALLHDITKKDELEKQLQYCREFGIIYDTADERSPKIFHAKTAAEVARRDFGKFVDDEILSGVRWHTTGRYGMTLFESVIYLADYIEETRKWESCVVLRKFFYDGLPDTPEGREERLVRTMVRSFDLTIGELIGEEKPIDADTVGARNWYLLKLDRQ